jgi:hypothetical protein
MSPRWRKKNVKIIQLNTNPIKTKEEENISTSKGLFKCQKMKMRTKKHKKRAKRHPKQ